MLSAEISSCMTLNLNMYSVKLIVAVQQVISSDQDHVFVIHMYPQEGVDKLWARGGYLVCNQN